MAHDDKDSPSGPEVEQRDDAPPIEKISAVAGHGQAATDQ
jgi:hypothetical protein